MLKNSLLVRAALVTLVGGALSAPLLLLEAGCSSGFADNGANPGDDAGVEDGSSIADSGDHSDAEGPALDGSGGKDGSGDSDSGGDAGQDDGGGPVMLPHILVVHASPELFAFRVCLEAGNNPQGTLHPEAIVPWPSDPSHPAPMSNFPAIALGSGALWTTAPTVIGPYLVPYLVDARQLANAGNDKTCDKLVCSSGSCLESSAFFALDAIETVTLVGSPAVLLAITGCAPGTGSTAECGADYDPSNGNLHAKWTRTAESFTTGEVATQFAQLSPNFGAASVAVDYADAGALAANVPYGSLAPSTLLPVPAPTDDPSAYASDELTLTGASGSLSLSLADITLLTDPSLLPSNVFAQGTSVVMAVVGDPSPSVGQIGGDGGPPYDGHGLHAIAVSLAPPADAGP